MLRRRMEAYGIFRAESKTLTFVNHHNVSCGSPTAWFFFGLMEQNEL